MVKEHQKYRAEILRVAGFALMTPSVKLFLNMLDFNFDFNIQFITNLLISLVLFVIGVTLLQEGYEEVKEL